MSKNASKPTRKPRTRARTRTRRPKFLRLSSWNSISQADVPSAMALPEVDLLSHSGDGCSVKSAVMVEDVTMEEKWISYGDVTKGEELNSCSDSARYGVDHRDIRRLALKLDYEEIMNAWSDKGPLYVARDMELESAALQIVPEIGDNERLWNHDAGTNVMIREWGLGSMEEVKEDVLFQVPEAHEGMKNTITRDEKEEDDTKTKGDELRTKMEQREASVLRYKEKRRNRLFSKRIRYEVRKQNAEKRPRLKGRFVKRS